MHGLVGLILQFKVFLKSLFHVKNDKLITLIYFFYFQTVTMIVLTKRMNKIVLLLFVRQHNFNVLILNNVSMKVTIVTVSMIVKMVPMRKIVLRLLPINVMLQSNFNVNHQKFAFQNHGIGN